jgi:hypothetical protein
VLNQKKTFTSLHFSFFFSLERQSKLLVFFGGEGKKRNEKVQVVCEGRGAINTKERERWWCGFFTRTTRQKAKSPKKFHLWDKCWTPFGPWKKKLSSQSFWQWKLCSEAFRNSLWQGIKKNLNQNLLFSAENH